MTVKPPGEDSARVHFERGSFVGGRRKKLYRLEGAIKIPSAALNRAVIGAQTQPPRIKNYYNNNNTLASSNTTCSRHYFSPRKQIILFNATLCALVPVSPPLCLPQREVRFTAEAHSRRGGVSHRGTMNSFYSTPFTKSEPGLLHIA